MKTNTSFLIVVVISILASSCSQEEELTIMAKNINTLESQETRLKVKSSPVEAYRLPLPLAAATLSPCGYGFNVSITWYGGSGGGPASYYYEIGPLGSGTPIDFGTISHGMNTPWVLAPCTTYEFSFFWGGVSPAIQIVTTDGCGGVFVC
jgi:hypothetical protein